MNEQISIALLIGKHVCQLIRPRSSKCLDWRLIDSVIHSLRLTIFCSLSACQSIMHPFVVTCLHLLWHFLQSACLCLLGSLLNTNNCCRPQWADYLRQQNGRLSSVTISLSLCSLPPPPLSPVARPLLGPFVRLTALAPTTQRKTPPHEAIKCKQCHNWALQCMEAQCCAVSADKTAPLSPFLLLYNCPQLSRSVCCFCLVFFSKHAIEKEEGNCLLLLLLLVKLHFYYYCFLWHSKALSRMSLLLLLLDTTTV